jgi:anti-anti-sigma factor
MQGTIDVEHAGGVLVATLQGEHDAASASLLRDAMAWWFSSGSAVIVDLSKATFLDSAVLRVLAGAHREQQPIALVAPSSGAVRRGFDLVHFDQMIPTYESRAEARSRPRIVEVGPAPAAQPEPAS